MPQACPYCNSARSLLLGNVYCSNHSSLPMDVIDPKKYIIVNQGQRYKTAFDTTEDHEMILVAFKPRFAGSILQNMVRPEDLLIDYHQKKGPESLYRN